MLNEEAEPICLGRDTPLRPQSHWEIVFLQCKVLHGGTKARLPLCSIRGCEKGSKETCWGRNQHVRGGRGWVRQQPLVPWCYPPIHTPLQNTTWLSSNSKMADTGWRRLIGDWAPYQEVLKNTSCRLSNHTSHTTACSADSFW